MMSKILASAIAIAMAIAMATVSGAALAAFELTQPSGSKATISAPATNGVLSAALARPVTGTGYSVPLPLAVSQIAPGALAEIGPGVDARIALSWNGQGRPADLVLRDALSASNLQYRDTGRSLLIERMGVVPVVASAPVAAPTPTQPTALTQSANPPQPIAQTPVEPVREPEPAPEPAEPSTWVIEPGLRLPDQIRKWGAAGGYIIDDSGIGSCECRIIYGDTIPGNFLTAVRKLVRPFAEQTPGVRADIHPNRVIRLMLARDELGGQ